MNTLRILGMALLVAGALALVYGGFSYTQEETAVKLGPLKIDVAQEHRVNIPVWGGLGVLALGGLLLVAGGRKG
jgi:hypothetical protein